MPAASAVEKAGMRPCPRERQGRDSLVNVIGKQPVGLNAVLPVAGPSTGRGVAAVLGRQRAPLGELGNDVFPSSAFIRSWLVRRGRGGLSPHGTERNGAERDKKRGVGDWGESSLPARISKTPCLLEGYNKKPRRKSARSSIFRKGYGGRLETRTPDLLHVKQAL